ncbi:hypothetical protein [Pseudotamlana agarivorans]|uniref:hypothetical protein n=1 Tax=Pseudotamlana agarivorans TaxID=481183 RepID=UPI000836D72B|nr:hypothetical protein [Tamlana agarivorans]
MENTLKSFRSKIFKAAHAAKKRTGESFSTCLKKAWGVYKLQKALKLFGPKESINDFEIKPWKTFNLSAAAATGCVTL